MVHLSDMRSIFNVGRMLGCTSYVCTGGDIRPRKLRDVFFITVSMIAYLCTFVILHVYVLRFDLSDTKGVFLTLTRVELYATCLFVDAGLTTLWNWKIRSVLLQLRNFDRATSASYHPSKRSTIRIVCRILAFVSLIYWAIVGYLTYKTETKLPVLRGLLYTFVYSSVSTQILIFIGVLLLIEERFRQLCNMLTLNTTSLLAKGKLTVSERLHGHFTLQQIWWLHCSLVNATEMLNSVYAIQLLLWISSMSINAMSRVYSLNVYDMSAFGKIRESMMALCCAWNLLLITTICHSTARRANRVGELIFAPTSSASMKRVFLQENLEAAAYFQSRKVNFFAIAGFIRVDLPLLLSIVSGMTTYLVILS